MFSTFCLNLSKPNLQGILECILMKNKNEERAMICWMKVFKKKFLQERRKHRKTVEAKRTVEMKLEAEIDKYDNRVTSLR